MMTNLETKIAELKKMNSYILGLDDAETSYLWARSCVPIAATERVYARIANDEERYLYCRRKYMECYTLHECAEQIEAL